MVHSYRKKLQCAISQKKSCLINKRANQQFLKSSHQCNCHRNGEGAEMLFWHMHIITLHLQGEGTSDCFANLCNFNVGLASSFWLAKRYCKYDCKV